MVRSPRRRGTCCGRVLRCPARTDAAGTRRRRAGSRHSTSTRCARRPGSSGSTTSRCRPTRPRSSCARAGSCAPSMPRTSRRRRTATRRRRAQAAGSIWVACACRSIRAPSGGRCCARCGGCSATTSGCRTCRVSTGPRCTTAMRHCSSASATRGELSDLIWEMQGELGTSHAYEMGGDHRRPPALALGHLAADLRLADDGSYAIEHIATGDPWEAEADSPLNAVGVLARPGERIVAVNGQPVSREVPPQALLVNQSGSRVGAHARPAKAGTREVVVSLAGRRSAGALPRMGRAQPALGARSLARPRRLPAPARHDVGRLCRVPPLLPRRVRPRRADHRRPLQPRRPRLAAAAGKGGAHSVSARTCSAGAGRRRTRSSRPPGRWWR